MKWAADLGVRTLAKKISSRENDQQRWKWFVTVGSTPFWIAVAKTVSKG